MAKPSFLSPGSVVRTTYAIHPQERGFLGYVRKTDHDVEAGQVRVTLVEGPLVGSSLLFDTTSLVAG